MTSPTGEPHRQGRPAEPGTPRSRRREHFFERLARHMGPAYLRYAFTKGTESEVDAVVEALGLEPGQRVLDVGCGPGRHAHALARRGVEVTGVDLSEAFVALARDDAGSGGSPSGRSAPGGGPAGQAPAACREGRASFVRADVLELPVRAGSMDAVISLCQGGFGLLGGGEAEADAIREMAGALRDGGRLALSAASAYFVVRHLEAGDSFDAATGVNHEIASVRAHDGDSLDSDLWTTCFTPRELRLMCALASLEVEHVWSVSPGSYRAVRPGVDHPEWLLIARKGGGRRACG